MTTHEFALSDLAARLLGTDARLSTSLRDILTVALQEPIEAELTASGYAFYRVIVPPQALESVVKIQVLPFRLANVSVSGNKHFSNENVLASLPSLRKGDTMASIGVVSSQPK